MSVEALVWAWNIEGLSPAQKSVLVALANYADQDRTCYPSVRRLMTMTALSERTVIRSIRDLEERGYLTTEQRSTDGGRQTSNLYRFTVPGREGATVAGGGGRGGTPGGATVAPLEPKKQPAPSDEGAAPARGKQLPDDFAVSDTMRAWAAEHCPGLDVKLATDEFRDYWRGQGQAKKDWEAVWRNAMRSAQDRGRFRDAAAPPEAARRMSVRERNEARIAAARGGVRR